MKNAQPLFVFLVTAELLIVSVLIWQVITRIAGKTMSQNTTVIPMNRETLSFPKSQQYPHFFELPKAISATESATWLPHEVTHTYNSDGLNDPFDYDTAKPPETFRIVTLGDSFTFGMWVPASENYSERLENMLNTKVSCPGISRFEVLNLGVPGYDIAYSTERFRTKGAKYSPDVLLWYIRDDDFFIINEEFYARTAFYQKELESTGAAKRYGKIADGPDGAVNLAYKEIYRNNGKLDSASRWEYTRPEREALRGFLSEYKLPVTVFTFSETPEEYKSYITEGIADLSNVSYFDDIKNVETFHPYDYHPTPRGHAVIAEALFTYLIRTNKALAVCRNK